MNLRKIILGLAMMIAMTGCGQSQIQKPIEEEKIKMNSSYSYFKVSIKEIENIINQTDDEEPGYVFTNTGINVMSDLSPLLEFNMRLGQFEDAKNEDRPNLLQFYAKQISKKGQYEFEDFNYVFDQLIYISVHTFEHFENFNMEMLSKAMIRCSLDDDLPSMRTGSAINNHLKIDVQLNVRVPQSDGTEPVTMTIYLMPTVFETEEEYNESDPDQIMEALDQEEVDLLTELLQKLIEIDSPEISGN